LDRLDQLARRLLENLDRQTDVPSSSCLDAALLEDLLGGRLDGTARQRAASHLDECLPCLDRFVELRDHLAGIAAPAPVSPRLLKTLDELIGPPPGETAWQRLIESARRALEFRVPLWAATGIAVVVLVTALAAHRFQQPGAPVEWPVDFSSPGQLTPTHRQASRTVAGTVSSVRDATSNGVEAHVVSVKDTAGATYVLFAWGPPLVGPGDPVEVQAIFTAAASGEGKPVYQGVATQLRRAR
jgi:hypothetical protein